MVSEKMLGLGSRRSCIRELFEFGRQRAEIVGRENIFDFSIGNPSTPAPEEVKKAAIEILETESSDAIHGYTSASGNDQTRDAIASSLNRRFGMDFTRKNLFITCGAAPALTATLKALTYSPECEYIAIAPFFPEYRCFVEVSGGKLVVVPADTDKFQIDFDELKKAINKNTQAVIINSPNNPSGVVYTEDTIKKLSDILRAKSEELGHPVFIIADEPYRELVYGGVDVPYIPKFYNNTIICYSYSKSLSLPGERIGYVLVPNSVDDFTSIYNAVMGGARGLGHVCAPSLMQKIIGKCVDVKPDLTVYERNRNLLYDSLTKMGYKCAKPDGAFYLFMEAPGGDAAAFSEKAKTLDLLIVPGADFGCPGHIRISYCVPTDRIERALPLFEKLIKM